MTQVQIEQIRKIQTEIDGKRDEMDRKNDPYPTALDDDIISNSPIPTAQQNSKFHSSKDELV